MSEFALNFAAFDHVNAVLTVHNSDGTAAFVNRYACQTLQLTYEKLLGSAFLDRLTPDDRTMLTKQFSDADAAPGASASVSVQILNGLNAWIPYEGKLNVVKNGVQGFLVIASWQSLSTQIGLEQRLARTRTLLDEAESLTHTGTYDVTLNPATGLAKRYWSCEFLNILDLPPDHSDFHPEIVEKLVHPADLAHYRREFVEATTKAAVFNFSFRILTGKGIEKTVESAGRNVVLEDGTRRITGFFRDISNHVRQIAALERQSQMIEQIDGALISTDYNGNIVSWNKSAEILYGYSAEEALGQHLSFLIPVNDRNSFDQQTLRHLSESGSYRCELVCQRKDGEALDAFLSLSRLRDVEGQPNGILGYSIDISERKRTERQLLEYSLDIEASRDMLEHYSQELTRVLDQATEATRVAEVATQGKSEFLAMMSHEIRTPLNGIIGMTGMLLEKSFSDEDRDCLETIRNSSEALLTIINDVLDFSKIEAGRLELECLEFDLSATVVDALQIVRSAASKKSILLSTGIDPALPGSVLGDSGRLRQILLNLLSNAIKFTPTGSIRIDVELQSTQNEVCEIRFRVTDQGIGLTPEQIGRLFRPFAQADASTTRRFGGTGLGLTICKRLAEQMGGAIGVESEYGKGSTFWFTIRVAPGKQSKLLSAKPKTKSAQSSGAIPTKNARLLLVEDNLTNQKVALMMLKKNGYTADVVLNGLEAVQAVARVRYHVIFMDCLMPEMDGYEATRRIRASSPYGAHVPIIAMTANAFAEDREACLAAGMSDYLPKPVRDEQLRNKLEHWLSRVDQNPAPSLIPTPEEDRFTSSVWALDAQLRDLVDCGQGDLVGELLRVYLTESAQHIASAQRALPDADFRALQFSAHALKGGSSSVGAVVMAATASRLQEASKAGDLKAAQDSLSILVSEFSELREAIQASLNRWDGNLPSV